MGKGTQRWGSGIAAGGGEESIEKRKRKRERGRERKQGCHARLTLLPLFFRRGKDKKRQSHNMNFYWNSNFGVFFTCPNLNENKKELFVRMHDESE